MRLVLLHVEADLPLRQTVALMAEAGGPEVSHVRLHKKIFRAVPYPKALVSGHDAHERPVLIHDRERERTIPGRLVATRLPAAQAEKARARLKRELGNKVTRLDREAAEYVVLFTTAPKSRLDTARCLALYRVRWQIELLFKRWKSLCGFDRLPNYLDETILAWPYAKVLLALLMQKMAASALSPPDCQDAASWGHLFCRVMGPGKRAERSRA